MNQSRFMKTFDNELKKSPSEQFSLRPAVPHVRYSPAGYRYSCCRRIVGLADSTGGGVQFGVRADL